jgi:quercetin dioxygenase-like cupin family protein
LALVRESGVEEFIPEGHVKCKTKILVGNNVGAKHLSLFKTEMEISGSAESHKHEFEQAFYVVKGKILVIIDGAEYEVGSGDVIFFPPNTTHSMKNIGKTRAILLGMDARA